MGSGQQVARRLAGLEGIAARPLHRKRAAGIPARRVRRTGGAVWSWWVTRRPNTGPDRTGALARRWLAEVTAERPGLERLAVTAARLAGVRIDHGEKTSIE
jgi:hypothetical protein